MTAIRMTAVTLTLLLGALVAPAETRLEANIPFDFQVGTTVLPAGDYQLVIESNGLVRMGLEDGSETVLFNTNASSRKPGDQRKGSELRFRRYDNRAFLAEIWSGYRGDGRSLRQNRNEAEAARTAGTIVMASVSAR